MKFAENTRVKRLAIYFFYDKDGIVDDYNIYLLNDLKKNVEELMVICNGPVNSEGESKFKNVCDNLLIRENTGFDVWAYKTALAHYGWEELSKYDEVILLNFTSFGPLYPFEDMFKDMSKRDIDFWGITKHYGYSFDPYGKCRYGYIPEHIQSSFIVIRNNMLKSQAFQSYWDNMGKICDYADAICSHEAIFTKLFNDKGFTSDVYVDTEDLKEFTDYPLMLYPKELVENRKCPVFKRKSFHNFYDELLNTTCGQPTIELYDYINKHTNYDVNFIWDNLLRTVNMYDMKERMHLNFILPKQFTKPTSQENKRIALMMHIYYSDLAEDCYEYAQSMPSYTDVYITVDTVEKKKEVEKVFAELSCAKLTVSIIENRGRDVSALLVGCKDYIKDYDYICFAHDKKVKQAKPYSIGESFAFHCFENVLGSKEFVINVISTLDENPRLGLLCPPPPHHSIYYSTIGMEWQGNFKNTVALAEKLGINLDFHEGKPPVAPLGTMFWFKAEALQSLFEYEWKYNDFPEEPIEGVDGSIMHAIERIYPYVAQDNGFYSAWLMTDSYSQIMITNLYKMVRDLNCNVFWRFPIRDRHEIINLIATLGSDGSSSEGISTRMILKLLARKILSEKNYNLLVKVRNKLLRKNS